MASSTAQTRSAFVTGAAMGMGMLMARKLAQRGWRVFAGVMPGLDTSELMKGVKLTVTLSVNSPALKVPVMVFAKKF